MNIYDIKSTINNNMKVNNIHDLTQYHSHFYTVYEKKSKIWVPTQTLLQILLNTALITVKDTNDCILANVTPVI